MRLKTIVISAADLLIHIVESNTNINRSLTKIGGIKVKSCKLVLIMQDHTSRLQHLRGLSRRLARARVLLPLLKSGAGRELDARASSAQLRGYP